MFKEETGGPSVCKVETHQIILLTSSYVYMEYRIKEESKNCIKDGKGS